jgi:hypothetical protein
MTQNEQNNTSSQEAKPNVMGNVKQFYKDDFKNIVVQFFKNPIQGIYSLFENPSEKAYSHSLILFSSVFVLYLIGGYIVVGRGRDYLELSFFIKSALIPLIFMFLLTLASFGIKSISGKPNLKNELLTGAISGIVFALIMLILLIVKLLDIYSIERIIKNPMKAGAIGVFILFYLILMLINVFQQSLKSSGTKDAAAWYLSPVAVLLSSYITYAMVKEFFIS